MRRLPLPRVPEAVLGPLRPTLGLLGQCWRVARLAYWRLFMHGGPLMAALRPSRVEERLEVGRQRGDEGHLAIRLCALADLAVWRQDQGLERRYPSAKLSAPVPDRLHEGHGLVPLDAEPAVNQV